MKLLKLLAAGLAIGVIVAAFRDFENRRWLSPAGVGGDGWDGEEADGDEEEEPVLGYDGMDQETLLDWLDGADPDPATLARMRRYEARHLAREPVLQAIESRL